jgi:hypothetical protein
MRILQKHNIIDIFVWVDDSLPKELRYSSKSVIKGSGSSNRKVGRPAALSVSEIITILLFSNLTAPQRLLKGIWKWAITNHNDDFKLPCYSKFVECCHRAIPHMGRLLKELLISDASLRFIDSTILPVCRRCRADGHKVAKGYADWGKNHQGWWYGFKLHAAIDEKGNLAAIWFTPANAADSQQIPKLVDDNTDIAVGDGGYNADVMRRHMWRDHKCFILAPPHPKQNKRLALNIEIDLLKAREKIECVFDYLKNNLNLVTSFPRSIKGYLLNYLRNLLGYQVGKMMGVI